MFIASLWPEKFWYILPVVTLVLYYGEKEWDGSVDLYGMMGVQLEKREILKEFVGNYKINLIHANNIGNLENYKTDLRFIFGMMQYKSDKQKLYQYIQTNRTFFGNLDYETFLAIECLIGAKKHIKAWRFQKYPRNWN